MGAGDSEWQDEVDVMEIWPPEVPGIHGGCFQPQTPELSRKVLTLAPPLLAKGSLGLVDEFCLEGSGSDGQGTSR